MFPTQCYFTMTIYSLMCIHKSHGDGCHVNLAEMDVLLKHHAYGVSVRCHTICAVRTPRMLWEISFHITLTGQKFYRGASPQSLCGLRHHTCTYNIICTQQKSLVSNIYCTMHTRTYCCENTYHMHTRANYWDVGHKMRWSKEGWMISHIWFRK